MIARVAFANKVLLLSPRLPLLRDMPSPSPPASAHQALVGAGLPLVGWREGRHHSGGCLAAGAQAHGQQHKAADEEEREHEPVEAHLCTPDAARGEG
jgi:hypothetical protein|eukprot:715678-Prymnesium_polylepis.2